MRPSRFTVCLLLLSTAALAAPLPDPVRWAPAAISSDQYDSSVAFSPGGRELLFMRSDKSFQNYRLMLSRCVDGRWTEPIPAPFAAPPPALEGDPFLSADGRTLFYISTRHGAEQGRGHEDLDIWTAGRRLDGSWGQTRRLPEPVNSTGAELWPRELADGRLIFGSDRPGGLGGKDIYQATPQPGGGWKVENLGAPVNSAYDEYEAEISRDGKTLIVVADRGDRSHLYRFERQGGKWVEKDRIPAKRDVFQVGPLLSPSADRLIFAQADGERSGEFFTTDLVPHPVPGWPPPCGDDARDPAKPAFTERPDWGKYFAENGVAGTLAIYDERSDQFLAFDAERADRRYLPASTFKIPHALFALDAGLVIDEFQVFPWDGEKRLFPSWNKDQDLRSSFRASTVWVYQLFARGLGLERERDYLRLIDYGNADPGGGLERFWLDGALRISAREQLVFLRRLHRNTLPFKVEHQRLVKDMIVMEAGKDFVLRGKTGWVFDTDPQLGWLVGWVEKPDGAVFFALNIDLPNKEADVGKREPLVRAILRELQALP